MKPGDKLGPYEILALIGKGGMGEVYRARDTKLKRDVALKVLPDIFARDPERMARFQREAEVLASLNHSNIAAIYGVEDHALVMELVEGNSPRGPLSFDESWQIASQMAAALEYAHDKGIVHRDLKPANIKITPDGIVKLLDFGLAKAFTNPGDARISPSETPENSPTLTIGATEVGIILGTAAYMAPEQAKGKTVDKRADIWSFGVVFYELLTGERLFQGEDAAETLAAVIHKQPDLSRVPAKACRLIEGCLEKDPKQRLRDIGDAKRLLIEDGPKPPEGGLAASSRPAMWMVAAAVLAIVTVVLGLVSYRHASEEPPRVTKTLLLPPEKTVFDERTIPAVSPDGRRIAVVVASGGKNLLWVRELDSLTARALSGTEGATYPFWSPDSRTLAFFADGKLKKMDMGGGPALTLCDVVDGFGGSWSKNDVIVFGTRGAIFRVAAAGGSVTAATTVDRAAGETGHSFPWFLPDGRHFLYTAGNSAPEGDAVYAAALDSNDRKRIVPVRSNAVYSAPGYLLFARERTLMAQSFDADGLQTTGDAVAIAEQVDSFGLTVRDQFAISQNGVLVYISGGSAAALQLTWYDRAGKALGTVGKPAVVDGVRLSPDGKTVATDRQDFALGSRDIWLIDLVRGTEQRLTFANNNFLPVWSPDGKRVAYGQPIPQKVVAKAVDGTGPEEQLEAVLKFPMDWTHDGRYLISATAPSNPKTDSDLWALPLVPGKSGPAGKPIPLRNSEFAEYHGRVSPDGRWLAYQSNESKRYEIYVVGFPGLNGHWQISVNGGSRPVWSRHGRELYFVSPDGKMMAVPVKSGEQFQAGVPQPLFDVRMSATPLASYDVIADGRFLIATPMEQAATPMTVVVNWPAMLKK